MHINHCKSPISVDSTSGQGTMALAMSFRWVEENWDITGHILRPLFTKAVSKILAKLLPKISFRS